MNHTTELTQTELTANEEGYEAGFTGQSSANPYPLADKAAEFGAWSAGYEQGCCDKRDCIAFGI